MIQTEKILRMRCLNVHLVFAAALILLCLPFRDAWVERELQLLTGKVTTTRSYAARRCAECSVFCGVPLPRAAHPTLPISFNSPRSAFLRCRKLLSNSESGSLYVLGLDPSSQEDVAEWLGARCQILNAVDHQHWLVRVDSPSLIADALARFPGLTMVMTGMGVCPWACDECTANARCTAARGCCMHARHYPACARRSCMRTTLN